MARILLLALAACAPGVPHRFASPMLGAVDVPAEVLPAERREPLPAPDAHVATIGEPVRVEPASHAGSQLPAPHRLAADAAWPALRKPDDLRALVGRRDARDAFAVTMGWARELGIPAVDSIAALARRDGHDVPAPGDLLVFARTESDDAPDLAGIAIASERGVTEFVYLAGGVVRRGFVDPARPAMRRDADGKVVNTYLRAGKRWPPKGTHYLAGELLVRVVR